MKLKNILFQACALAGGTIILSSCNDFFHWFAIFIIFSFKPCHYAKVTKWINYYFFINFLLTTRADDIFFTFYIF